MSTLSSKLLAVLEALPSSIPSTIILKYKQIIIQNIDTLNDVVEATPATLACKACKVLFGDRTILPQEPSYREELEENWSTTCWLPAACIIKIQNIVEVALALKVITRIQSRFAIRSAGHMANPGFSSVDQTGILLDLSALNEISLSANHDLVTVGPGAAWDKVYTGLEKHELTVVGGRANGVGVGGLILGGGMSHFSNYWGMVCDNVKNFEVVCAESTVVQANSLENTDLFRALKGGGPNFGIVTRFDLYTYPDYQVWYTFKVYNGSDSERIIKASLKVQQAMEDDDRIGFFLSINPGFFVAGMLYRGECTSAPAVFNVFDNITPIATPVPETNASQLTVVKAASIEGKIKREIGGITVRPDADLYVELQKLLVEISTSTDFSLAFTIQPFGAPTVKKGEKYGGNSMNILPESQSWLAIIVQWSEDKDDYLARSQIRQLISGIGSTAKDRGLLMDFQFMNDASFIQSPLKSYGKESLASLGAASCKWDKDGVFQRLQNSGFLLSNVET